MKRIRPKPQTLARLRARQQPKMVDMILPENHAETICTMREIALKAFAERGYDISPGAIVPLNPDERLW